MCFCETWIRRELESVESFVSQQCLAIFCYQCHSLSSHFLYSVFSNNALLSILSVRKAELVIYTRQFRGNISLVQVKAAFYYSSQLRTCLKRAFFLRSICLARARTSEHAANSRQVFDKKVESWSKAGKRVANPHELVENLAANLVENQVCSQVAAG